MVQTYQCLIGQCRRLTSRSRGNRGGEAKIRDDLAYGFYSRGISMPDSHTPVEQKWCGSRRAQCAARQPRFRDWSPSMGVVRPARIGRQSDLHQRRHPQKRNQDDENAGDCQGAHPLRTDSHSCQEGLHQPGSCVVHAGRVCNTVVPSVEPSLAASVALDRPLCGSQIETTDVSSGCEEPIALARRSRSAS